MKVEIIAKYMGSELKTSEKGNTYQNVAIFQGVDSYKLYYPCSEKIELEPFTDIKGVLNISKDKWGTHITLEKVVVLDGARK